MPALVQQSEEWLLLRKSKIGASDASTIMGVNPWKTKYQLWEEKISDTITTIKSERMQRGLDLEEMARELFTIKTGLVVQPDVRFSNNYEWMMASLDGIDVTNSHIVEIKCPGKRDHATAISGQIPEHYYPQLQHQMEVCNVDKMFYFSFDGLNGVIIEVDKNEDYIAELIEEERKFFHYMITKQPP